MNEIKINVSIKVWIYILLAVAALWERFIFLRTASFNDCTPMVSLSPLKSLIILSLSKPSSPTNVVGSTSQLN